MDVAQIKRVTATGDVTTATSYLRSVVFVGGTAASTLDVRTGGATGPIILSLKAAIDQIVTIDLGAYGSCPGGIHATVGGAAAAATFVYS